MVLRALSPPFTGTARIMNLRYEPQDVSLDVYARSHDEASKAFDLVSSHLSRNMRIQFYLEDETANPSLEIRLTRGEGEELSKGDNGAGLYSFDIIPNGKVFLQPHEPISAGIVSNELFQYFWDVDKGDFKGKYGAVFKLAPINQ